MAAERPAGNLSASSPVIKGQRNSPCGHEWRSMRWIPVEGHDRCGRPPNSDEARLERQQSLEIVGERSPSASRGPAKRLRELKNGRRSPPVEWPQKDAVGDPAVGDEYAREENLPHGWRVTPAEMKPDGLGGTERFARKDTQWGQT